MYTAVITFKLVRTSVMLMAHQAFIRTHYDTQDELNMIMDDIRQDHPDAHLAQ